MRSLHLLAMLLIAAGCNQQSKSDALIAPIRDATSVTLLSLDPLQEPKEDPANFHEWVVLGKIEVRDESIRKRVVDLVASAIDPEGQGAFCFHPRHGLRVTSKYGTFDYLLCFECGNGTQYTESTMTNGFAVSDAPSDLLNQILTDNQIALPVPPRK